MYVRALSVTDFRSWPQADLVLEPGVTVLVGANGQGKTNLVEAVGYLATLSSHRVSTEHAMIRQGMASAIVRARLEHDGRERLGDRRDRKADGEDQHVGGGLDGLLRQRVGHGDQVTVHS